MTNLDTGVPGNIAELMVAVGRIEEKLSRIEKLETRLAAVEQTVTHLDATKIAPTPLYIRIGVAASCVAIVLGLTNFSNIQTTRISNETQLQILKEAQKNSDQL